MAKHPTANRRRPNKANKSNKPRLRKFRPYVERLEARETPANINITAFHYDPFIQGNNTQESILNPTNVNQNSFGNLVNVAVDGYTYAQPLYLANLVVGGTMHNVAFVATEHDSLYAFDIIPDATQPTGLRVSNLWAPRSFINPAMGITSVPQPDVISGDIVPEIGITGAPVIDTTTNTLYLVAKTKEVRGDGNHYVQKLYAIDVTTGLDRTAPYTIGDTHGSATFANENTAIMVPGAGEETSGGANPMIPFSALKENNRSSLQLLNSRVYVAWASHGDNTPYHGWVIGFNETTLQPEKIFNTSPNAGAVGIWQSEGAVSTDGRYLYFAVGNGFNGPNLAFDPAHGNYSESVIKLDTQAAGMMMPVTDYFTPFNWVQLDQQDADLGSGGVMLLPDSVGGGGHTHLMVETGKDGHIYLIDRDNLGQFTPGGPNNIVQDVVAGPGGVWGNPAFYQESANSGLLIYHGSGSDTREFRITGGTIQQVSGSFIAYRSNQTFGFPGAQPVITSNNGDNTTAISWELQSDNYGARGPETLHAYTARPSAQTGTLTELYNSNQAGLRDRLGGSVKFTSAIVTNGWVFVGQEFNFSIFGLFPTHNAAPVAPTNLHGMGTSPTSIQINWTSPSPNTATGIKIFRSVNDDQHFALFQTVAAGVTQFNDTGLSQSGTYFYKLAATNQIGDSPQTAEIQVNPLIAPPVLSVDNISSAKVSLTWTVPAVANDHYIVDRSTDPTFMTGVVSSGSIPGNMPAYIDNNSTPGQYFYRVRAFTAAAQVAISNSVAVKVGPNAGVIDYSTAAGFSVGVFDLSANGSAQFAETSARLTNAVNQAGSVFSLNEENILNFTTSFNVRLHEGTQPSYANGFTFVIQAVSQAAVGTGGPGLGYQGIPESVAIKFETTSGASENGTGGSTGLFFGGDAPTVPHQPGEVNIMLDATMVNLLSQSNKDITVSYAYNAANPSASVLHEVITDPDHPATPFMHDYTIDIPSQLGLPVNGNTIGYVGFTGSTGTGGFWEIQDIQRWLYTPNGPAAPHSLSVVSNVANTANALSWKATTADEEGYYVERSQSPTTGFTRIATITAAANTWTYNDTGLTNAQSYFYRVQTFNHSGATERDSGYSNVASGAVVSINFPSFPANPSNLSANHGSGTTTVNIFPGSPAVMRLTDGQNNEDSSSFYTTRIGVGPFSTTFMLHDVPNGGAADSVSFIIQNDPRGLTAIGPAGGAGGYQGITNSIAVKFDLYTQGSHNSSTGLYLNGESPADSGPQFLMAPVDLRTGDPMVVTLNYDGTSLNETIRDTVTSAMFQHSYTLNLMNVIGGNIATVGFSGATGGENATQDIVSWSGTFPQAPPQLTSFTVSPNPGTITAGQTTQITVSARDQNGNVFPGYTGTVHFTSNDPQSMLPPNYQFVSGDNGVHTFTVTLRTAGSETVTATDTNTASVTGTGTVTVNPDVTRSLLVSGFPTVILPGAPGSFSVAAKDQFGNTTPAYRGTIHFTSTDPMATLPMDHQFQASDNGVFNTTATLRTLGFQSITATDTVTPSITGTQSGINVQRTGTVSIDFSSGFGNHTAITSNGSTSFPTTPPVLRLTDGGNGEAASAYYNTPVGPGAFNTTFTFAQHQPATNPPADGFTFVIQADPRGVNALGDGGGSLGYGHENPNDGQPPAITASVAIKFDIWKGFNGPDTNHSSTGLYINGHRPNNPPNALPGDQPVDLAGTAIDLIAGLNGNHQFTVNLNYDGNNTLTEMITDNTTHGTFTHAYTINIGQVIGTNVAHVGFTGGTGGANSTQDIVTWTGIFQQAGAVTIPYTNNFADQSNLVANTLSNNPALNTFPPAFVTPRFTNFTNHASLSANGNVTFPATPPVLRLTNGGGGQASSAFLTTPIGTGAFTTTFTLQDNAAATSADGASFVIQNDPRGTGALGGGGGGEGYAGIIHSIAIKFDLWTDGHNGSETGLFLNGASPDGNEANDISMLPAVDLHSGHAMSVTLTYLGTTLSESVTDTVTHMTFSHNYTINLAQVIGGSSAFVGFTGGTGGVASTQDIVNWTGTFQGVTTPPVLQLTDGRNGEATTAFFNTPIGTGPFSTSFTLKDIPINGAADGVTFIIQADPRASAALGGGGGGEGYAGITHSIAIKFDLYAHGTHNPLTGLFTGGNPPDGNPAFDVPLTGINLGSGDPMRVDLSYDGANLTEMVTDTITNAMFSHTYTGLNLPQVIGGNAAYVGFGGGTGGENAVQQILNWTGTFAPPAASTLGVSAATTANAGAPTQVTVRALDQNGNPLPNYIGTVHLTSSDPLAVLPGNYTFTAADHGVHTFSVTLNTTGAQSVTATDVTTGSIMGTTGIAVRFGSFSTIDYSNGFGAHTGLTGNGTATFVGPNADGLGVFAGHQDIGTAGDPSPAGNATFDNATGTYRLSASGSDIWGTQDHFQYLYEPLTGNGSIVARLVSASAADFWTKAGVMFRTDLSTGSANAFMLDAPNPTHQEPVQQWRDAANGGTADTGNHGNASTPNVATPIWLKLVRSGNDFIGFWALDNNGAPGSWNEMTDHTTVMPATVYVGLALTAHNNGAIATATFDHVSVTGAPAPLASAAAQLTDGGTGQAGSVFTNNRVDVSNFTTTFTLRDTLNGHGAADGVSFVLQNDPRGAHALGNGGGDEGYGGINNSIAIKFDLYSHSSHTPTTGLFTGGNSPAGDVTKDVSLTGINLGSGDPLQVTLTYNGTTLSESVVDTVTHATFNYDYLINIPQVIGSSLAYAGFTGGTGGETAIQQVLNWTGTFPTAPTSADSLTVTTAQPTANVVTNGGFEAGNFNGWTLNGFGGGEANIVTGTAGGAGIHSGTHAGQFGPGTVGTITQNVPTIPGLSYKLDFWLSNPLGGAGTEWLVRVNGNTLRDVTNAPTFNYREFIFTFTATSATTNLQFGFAHPPDWFYLDDVSVTPTNAVAGIPVQLTATLQDAAGHRIGAGDTVHFTSTDPQAILPADYTFTTADNGQHAFNVTFASPGNQVVFINDQTNPQISATAVAVVSAPILVVNPLASPILSGTPESITVLAPVGYTGTVHFTSSDPNAVLPADYTFTAADNGSHTFTATLYAVGTDTVTATDTAFSTATSTGTTTVLPAQFIVSGFASPTEAGAAETFTVSALDGLGNVATNYTGTVHFSSSDGQASLPANYTFTAADQGSHLFGGILFTAGTQSITATDTGFAALTGSQTGIVVTPSDPALFVVSGFPSPIVAGTPGSLTVTVEDAFGNVVPTYTGTVAFSSTDGQASLPGNYTFTASDNGSHSFTATLFTAGTQSITVTDTVTFMGGVQDGIQVTPSVATSLQVNFPSPVTAGQVVLFTVTAFDAYGNVATGYTGTVTFFSSDPAASLPGDTMFSPSDNGVHTFAGAMNTPGFQDITVLDTSDSTINGSQFGIEVDPSGGGSPRPNGRLGYLAIGAAPAANVAHAASINTVSNPTNVPTTVLASANGQSGHTSQAPAITTQPAAPADAGTQALDAVFGNWDALALAPTGDDAWLHS